MGAASHDSPGAAELERAAREAVAAGDFGLKTLALLERLVEQRPEETAWNNLRGRCLVALGRYDEAAAAFAATLARKPADDVARSQIKRLVLRVRARERALRLLDHSTQALFDALQAAKDSERDVDFQVEGRRLLARREPDNPAAVCALGAAQRRAGDRHGALNTYRHAWRLDGQAATNAMAHVGLAAVLRDLGRRDEARRLYRDVLEARPSDPYASLGLAAVLMDDHEQGVGDRPLAEARTRLDRVWAGGHRTAAVKAAYGRLGSLAA